MLVTQSCLTLCNPVDCSPPGSSACSILRERILEWVATPSSRGSPQPRDRTQVSCIAGRFFTTEPPGKPHANIPPLQKCLREQFLILLSQLPDYTCVTRHPRLLHLGAQSQSLAKAGSPPRGRQLVYISKSAHLDCNLLSFFQRSGNSMA